MVFWHEQIGRTTNVDGIKLESEKLTSNATKHDVNYMKEAK